MSEVQGDPRQVRAADERRRWTAGFRVWHAWLLLAVVAGSLLLRFTSLESIPGPAYIDEAATAANAMCLAQQGTSALGDRWPLFVEVLVGNWEPPMIAYPTAIIAKVGDGSMGNLRLFPAIVVIGIAIAVFLLGRELADTRAGVYASLLVLLAPWSFVAGRLLWKSPLAPLFVVLGVYMFVRGLRTESASTMALSALAFALALYSYQSSWAQVPLLIAALAVAAVYARRSFVPRAGLTFGVVILVACVPLLVLLMSGGLMKRAADVSVFSDDAVIGSLRFARNYLLHFSPDFLFWSGDSNLRHGVGDFGQLSWLDLFAILVGAGTLWKARAWCLVHRRLVLVAVLGVT